MESKENELFEAYLEGSLPLGERTAFEEKLKSDIQLREEFTLFEDVYKVLTNKYSPERNDFLNTLKEVNAEFIPSTVSRSPKTTIISFKPWHYGIAASILLAVGLFLFNDFGNPSYSDFATHQEISLVVRSETDQVSKKAETAFNSKNYQEAVVYFDELIKSSPENTELQYYKAVSLVEINHFQEAESILNNLSKGTSVYATKAVWMIALSKMKQKDYKGTKEVLKTIPATSSEYQKAKKLLETL